MVVALEGRKVVCLQSSAQQAAAISIGSTRLAQLGIRALDTVYVMFPASVYRFLHRIDLATTVPVILDLSRTINHSSFGASMRTNRQAGHLC